MANLMRDSGALLAAYEKSVADGGDKWYDHAWKYPVAVLGDLAGTVVNSGISLYNFAAPESIEAEHIDKYAFLTNDMASYAEENADAVALGSFVAGVVIPGLGVTKAMSLARTGQGAWGYAFRGIGLNHFNAKIERSVAAANEAAKLGAQLGETYYKARRSAKLWTGAEALTENALVEASIMLTLNEHEYFERGWNPTLGIGGVMLGTGITGWLKWARVNGTIARTAGATQQQTATDLTFLADRTNWFKSLGPAISAEYGAGTLFEANKAILRDTNSAASLITEWTLDVGQQASQARFGGILSDFVTAQRAASEEVLLNIFDKMGDPQLRKGLRPGVADKPWEFAPRPADQLNNLGPVMSPERFHYFEPEKSRMAFHFLMGQDGQAIGVTKLESSLNPRPLETVRSPYVVNTDGTFNIEVNDRFWSILDHGLGVKRGVDSNDPTIIRLPRPAKFNALDKKAKYTYDAPTNSHHFDLSGIFGTKAKLEYLAYQAQQKQAKNLVVNFGGRGGTIDDAYKLAAANHSKQIGGAIESRFNSPAEARANLPDYLDEYMTVRRWNGQTVQQASIDAHMTKTAGHIYKGDMANFRRQHADHWWRQFVAGSEKKPVKLTGQLEYTPMKFVLRPVLENGVSKVRQVPLVASTAKVDAQFVGAYDAMARINPELGVLLPIDHANLPALQAAFVHGQDVAGFNSAPALFAHIQELKIANIRNLVNAVPDIDNMQLSILTNTPLETLNLIRAGIEADPNIAARTLIKQQVRSNEPLDWLVHTGRTDTVEQLINEPTVSAMGRASHKLRGPDIAAKLDREGADVMERELINELSARYGVGRGNRFIEALDVNLSSSADHTLIRERLDEFVALAKGGSVLTSSDFALRHFGPLGAAVTKLGANLETITNNKLAEFQKLIVPQAKVLTANKAALTQYEYVHNALAALGPKDFDRNIGLTFTQDNRILLRPEVTARNGSVTPAQYLKYPNGQDIVVLPQVRTFMDTLETAARDIWEVRELNARIYGKEMPLRRNFWTPSPSLDNAMQAFVYDTKTHKFSRLIGRDKNALIDEVARFKADNKARIDAGELQVHWRNEGELGHYRRMQGLAELEHASSPLPTLGRAGIASQKITGSAEFLDTILRNFEAEYVTVSRGYVRAANQDILRTLETIDEMQSAAQLAGNTTKAGKPLDYLGKVQNKVTPARMAMNSLLNKSMQDENLVVKAFDDFFSASLDKASLALRKAGEHMDAKFKLGDYNEATFQEYLTELQRNNIPIPFASEVEFALARTPELKPIAKNLTAQTNAVVATLALRLFDFAHPIVTTLTAPLMMNAELVGTGAGGHLKAVRAVYDGSKEWLNHALKPSAFPETAAIMAKGKELGHMQLHVSEATAVLAEGFGSANFWTRAEKTSAFKAMVWASDKAESATREVAYLTGYRVAQRTSPNAGEALWHTEAAAFVTRSMGNYTARQRPIFFQGAAGQAIGLFQTFMWTLGQNLFRYAENQQMNAIAGLMGGYTGMFGISSLPGYNIIDEALGEYSRSNDDIDATQLVYRAFGDKVNGHDRTLAEYILFGLPSTMTQTAFWTRGELQPRLPTNEGGLPWPPAAEMAVNGMRMIADTASKATMLTSQESSSPWYKDIPIAVAEGLASQYVWRPAARIAELGLGYTVDYKGETVMNQEDMYGGWEVFARVMGARPLKEQVIRNMNFRHKLYDMADQGRRRKLYSAMRTSLRTGGNPMDYMAKYIDQGGDFTGWRQVLNELHLTEAAPGAQALLREVAKQPGIAGIMEGYAF